MNTPHATCKYIRHLTFVHVSLESICFMLYFLFPVGSRVVSALRVLAFKEE